MATFAGFAALAAVAAFAFGSSLSACDADPGVDNLPGVGQHGQSGGGDGGGSSPTGEAGAADATTDGGFAVTAASACADLAAARCKRNDACTNGFYSLAAYGDEITCETRTNAQCVLELSATGTSATPSGVEACAVTIPTQPCANAFDEMPTPACVPAAGSLTSGAACIASSQCASAYCALAPDAVCGSCAPLPKSGDHCASAAECGSRGGLACAAGVCLPVGQQSNACSASIPCGFGLTCAGSTPTAAGTCQPSGGDAGASCDPTASTSCNADLGLACDPVSKQCVAVTYAAAGKPCGELDGGLTRCSAGACVIAVPDGGAMVDAGPDAADAAEDAGDGGAVDAADAGTAGDSAPPSAPVIGTCVGAAKEGAACDLSSGPPCLAPAECVVGDGGTVGLCTLPSVMTCK